MRVGKSGGHEVIYQFVSRRDRSSGADILAAVPVLAPDEIVIECFPETKLRLAGLEAGALDSGKGGYPSVKGDTTFFDPGKRPGTIFVTNSRLIFLRRGREWAEAYHAFIDDPKLHAGTATVHKRVIDYAAIEFCEVPFEEIIGLDRRALGGYVLVQAGERRYRLWLKRNAFSVLEKLLKSKRAGSQ